MGDTSHAVFWLLCDILTPTILSAGLMFGEVKCTMFIDMR